MKEGIMEDDRKGTWEDVTKECELELNGQKGSYVTVRHNHKCMAHLGQVGEVSELHDKKEYRVAFDEHREDYTGHFTVEHFIPEPVIAYKAVIEVDGEYVSTFAGGPLGRAYDELAYRIGKTTTSERGTGIYCTDTLKAAMRNYPPADSDDRREGFDRKDGRVAILRVEGIGVKEEADCMAHRESVVFPSVKVLSVAWEEKEEWVDVTEECTVRLNYILGDSFGGGVYVEHDGNLVISYGGKAHDESNDRDGYRVSFSGDDYQGYFKVEKRND